MDQPSDRWTQGSSESYTPSYKMLCLFLYKVVVGLNVKQAAVDVVFGQDDIADAVDDKEVVVVKLLV